jgi:magnesium chelatase family protein
VEADTTFALPGIFIVGLPDKAVDESRERVRSAIKNSGLEMPRSKVTINLAPADLKKEGPAYDLPIAVSILLVSGQLKNSADWHESLFIGELALDGKLRSCSGVLSICLFAKARGIKKIYLPNANADEAALVSDLEIYALPDLRSLAGHLSGKNLITVYRKSDSSIPPSAINESAFDMSYIKGQDQVKRALEIAAAGGHNILVLWTVSHTQI